MRQALGPGALGKPRGSGWRGRWEGGSGWGAHVNPWLFHSNVWQNSLQKKKKSTCQGWRVGRWKVSSAPDASTLGGLISYAFSIICSRKQIHWMSYLQFHSLPSFCFPFLLTVLPSLLSFLVSSFLPFSFFDFRQWQLEMDPEFSVCFCHMFHWGGVIGETDCMKENHSHSLLSLQF